MLTRRCFLRNSALAAVGFGTVPRWLLAAKRSAANEAKILIAIFQRSAADGLNIVPPFFEKAYYQARPSIAVPLPGRIMARSTSTEGSG